MDQAGVWTMSLCCHRLAKAAWCRYPGPHTVHSEGSIRLDIDAESHQAMLDTVQSQPKQNAGHGAIWASASLLRMGTYQRSPAWDWVPALHLQVFLEYGPGKALLGRWALDPCVWICCAGPFFSAVSLFWGGFKKIFFFTHCSTGPKHWISYSLQPFPRKGPSCLRLVTAPALGLGFTCSGPCERAITGIVKTDNQCFLSYHEKCTVRTYIYMGGCIRTSICISMFSFPFGIHWAEGSVPWLTKSFFWERLQWFGWSPAMIPCPSPAGTSGSFWALLELLEN